MELGKYSIHGMLLWSAMRRHLRRSLKSRCDPCMPAARPRHGGMVLVLVAIGLCILMQTFVLPVQSQGGAIKLKPYFYGRATIAHRPADDGTYVDAVVIRGVNDYKVCGRTKVGEFSELTKLLDIQKTIGPGAYFLPIDTSPQCINPQTRYSLFINVVRADNIGEFSNLGFTSAGGNRRVDVNVPEVALVTLGPNNAPFKNNSVPVVYFWGWVHNLGKPLRMPAMVTVQSEDGTCSATEAIRDLYWQPKTGQPVGILSFYYVAIVDKSGACADRTKRYLFYVNGVLMNPKPPWTTPPYAMGVNVNLQVEE